MKVTNKLVHELVDAAFTLRELEFEDGEPDPIEPELRPPATEQELRALEACLRERALPPIPASYRAFLKVCNGIDRFKPEPYDAMSLLGTRELMRPPPKGQRARYPSLSRFTIARGDSLEFIAFDPEAVHGHEMEVVWVTPEGEETRYPSFTRFLESHLAALRSKIAARTKRRAPGKSGRTRPPAKDATRRRRGRR